jgi:hypothetical protein
LRRHAVDSDPEQFLRLRACRCLGRGQRRGDIDPNTDTDLHSYHHSCPDSDGYANSDRYSCTHVNTFTNPDSHSYRHGYANSCRYSYAHSYPDS